MAGTMNVFLASLGSAASPIVPGGASDGRPCPSHGAASPPRGLGGPGRGPPGRRRGSSSAARAAGRPPPAGAAASPGHRNAAAPRPPGRPPLAGALRAARPASARASAAASPLSAFSQPGPGGWGLKGPELQGGQQSRCGKCPRHREAASPARPRRGRPSGPGGWRDARGAGPPPGAAPPGAAELGAQENVRITAAPRPPPPPPGLPPCGQPERWSARAVNPGSRLAPYHFCPRISSPFAAGSVAPRQPPPLRFSGCGTGWRQPMRALSMRPGALRPRPRPPPPGRRRGPTAHARLAPSAPGRSGRPSAVVDWARTAEWASSAPPASGGSGSRN